MAGKRSREIRVYEPDTFLKAGIRIWGEMFWELVNCRGLLWRLMIRDITARYRQTLLGMVWPFLIPLTTMIIFVWIKNSGILPIGETTMPYSTFVFLGQMVWLLFSRGVSSCASSLVEASMLLTKINFPKEVLVVSAMGQTVFEFLIRIPLLMIICYVVDFLPHPMFLLTPLVIVPFLFLILGVGFLVSLFNAIIRDVGNVLGMVLGVGMFLCPVVYPPPREWPLSFVINFLNPVSGYITMVRDLTSAGHASNFGSYVFAVLVSLFVFVIGWRVFHLMEPTVVERI